MSPYPYDAKRRVTALIETLEPLVKRDPEQVDAAIGPYPLVIA